jgi:hypothetical protein
VRGARRVPEASTKKPGHLQESTPGGFKESNTPSSAKAETTPEFGTKKEIDKDGEGKKEDRVHGRIRLCIFIYI